MDEKVDSKSEECDFKELVGTAGDLSSALLYLTEKLSGLGEADFNEAAKSCLDELTKRNSVTWLRENWIVLNRAITALQRGARTLSAAQELSFIDDITNLYNQRYLRLILDKEIQRAERLGVPFSVLFMDVDKFKSVNDTKGHLVGTKLLKQVSDILKSNIRVMDYGFRYGGDEFILILTDTDKNGAYKVAERIREQVEQTEFSVEGLVVHLTLSIGVSSYPEHAKTKEDVLRLADEAMYIGKNKSRNIVKTAS